MFERFRLKKQQTLRFQVSKPCTIAFSRLGGGAYVVEVTPPQLATAEEPNEKKEEVTCDQPS